MRVHRLKQREMRGLCRLTSPSSSGEERCIHVRDERWKAECMSLLSPPISTRSEGENQTSTDAFRVGCPGDLLALSQC